MANYIAPQAYFDFGQHRTATRCVDNDTNNKNNNNKKSPKEDTKSLCEANEPAEVEASTSLGIKVAK